MPLPHIIRIAILPFGMVNCHLIAGPQGCILVDTGLPGSEAKIGRALRRHGMRFSDIRLIVVTHAHVDHAGSAARLRELSGAPIVGHAGDIDYYQQRKTMTFCSTGWFGRLFLKTGLMRQPYTPFQPDILLADGANLDLQRFGAAGAVRHTPGHTAGSISVQLAGMEVMAGDLLASGILLGGIVRTGRAMRPPFEDDPHAVAAELQHLLDGGAHTFYIGHGGPLRAAAVARHVQALRALPRRPPPAPGCRH
ncbi:MBL fold metallo-hydrolase [Rugamonas sp.]|uniref:MBL fold metallo-hydrolase n=1 Tax=Rugamonas sp. TaxID=1926287 RepID=UPI0025D3079E|nr:MBL fold metallo-hydrolase [Rugamonas sp.]